MRGTAATGWGLLVGALVLAVLIVAGLAQWDSNARAQEIALRPAPVAPLAFAATPTPPTALDATSEPAAAASAAPASAGAPAGNAAAGHDVFADKCSSCHPRAGAGIGPALYGPEFSTRFPQDSAIDAVVRQGKGGMPAFGQADLSDQDLANVTAYLRALGSGAMTPEPTPTRRPTSRG